MGSHIYRLGFIRVLIGAIGIYLSIPVFLLIHAIVIQVLLKFVVHPFLNLGDLATHRFIVLDRYKVSGLSIIDRLHCLFCGWANGLNTLLNYTVDTISKGQIKICIFQKTILYLLCLLYLPSALIVQTCFFFIYNLLIAAPLSLEKVYYGSLIRTHINSYARSFSGSARLFLVYQKISWAALGLALKQIESAWCPIRHFEKMEGVIYPDHHRHFFEPDQIEQLRTHLMEYGTVLSPPKN